MKIASLPQLDALCGEYLLGTLRGAARRRFERALREEPRVALRFSQCAQTYAPRYSNIIDVEPSVQSWKRLERELQLARYRTPWHRRVGLWRAFTIAVTAALAFAIGLPILRPDLRESATVPIAQLEGKADVARVTAMMARDRRTLELRAARPVIAGPAQSYELWLLPAEGGAPLSLAVLGSLDAR